MKTIFNLLCFLVIIPVLSFSQNTGLRFDGTEEKLSIPFKAELNPSDNYTIEAWIFAENWKALSWQGSLFTNDAQGPDRGFALRCGEGGKLSFVMSVDNQWQEVLSPALMNTKQWHHVAAVVDNGTMYLYVDGLQAASATYSGTITPSDGSFTVAESTGFSGRYFEGILDEFRIWNVARSAAEIADNKTTALTGSETGLVAYLPMNDGSGTTVTNVVDAACSATTLEMDDSNWVEGYTLPEFDVSVKNISNIDRVHMKNRPVKIKFDIQNVGTRAISDISAEVYVDGNLIAEEAIDATIQPGEFINHCFESPIDLQGIDNPEITVSLVQANDANALNNQAELTIVTKAGNRVSLFERSQHNFGAAGQTQSNAVMLPGDLSAYSQLLLHISVDCPSGGCDPWDQTAKVSALTSEGTFEIARYITPYGIACGPWTVDVTDFKSVLTGEVLYDSFVSVFGQSGWLVTIELELIEGTATLPYSKCTAVHRDDYHVYGDPGIEDDLAPVELVVADNTEASHLRMHMTGHGQGNTNNAAEFFPATHAVMLNGSKLADHSLWKSDCAANDCSNQGGNWTPSRAGWCPGQEVTPAIFNTTGSVDSGQTTVLDYELQDYTNLLNTGYNNSGHTEPHYRIHSVFVENSSEAYEEFTNLTATAIEFSPNSTNADKISGTVTNTGNQLVVGYTVNLYLDGELVAIQEEDLELIQGASITVDFNLDFSTITSGNFIIEAVTTGDQSPGDDLLSAFYEGSVSTEDPALKTAFSITPNPTTDFIHLQFDESMMNSRIVLYKIDGKIVDDRIINQSTLSLPVRQAGTYLVKLVDTKGDFHTKKVMVLD